MAKGWVFPVVTEFHVLCWHDRPERQLPVTLDANNVFAKRCYQTVGTSNNGNFYGEPRNFVLTVWAKY